jgi:hypothetical protein
MKKLIFAGIFTLLSTVSLIADNYYVDAVNGSDTNAGTVAIRMHGKRFERSMNSISSLET